MSTTPVKKKKRNGSYARKKRRWLPLAAGFAVVCALVGGILALESALEQPQPTQTTAPPTEATLPPNLYSAEDFAYEDGYLRCTAGDYALGIDVSSHQQEVDWTQVAGAGMEFAFVRIGYRGYSEGKLHTDEYAAENLTQAKAAGLQVGAYFYSQAINVEEAAREAALCVEFLKDHPLDLPLVYDWEYVSQEARTGAMDCATLTQCALTFCRAVEEAGYEAMIYANPDIAGSLYDLKALQDYRFWLALYSDTMDYPYKMDFWQYTDQGSVPGVEGNVDINLMFIYD